MPELTIRHGQTVIARVAIEHVDDWVTIELDGRNAVGFDCFYFDGTNDDSIDDSDKPKLVLGCWPDGEEWKRLAHIPLDGSPIVPATGDAL